MTAIVGVECDGCGRVREERHYGGAFSFQRLRAEFAKDGWTKKRVRRETATFSYTTTLDLCVQCKGKKLS